MSAVVKGLIDWKGQASDDGHLDLMATWLVNTDDWQDGPFTAGQAAGLPAVYSSWALGNDNHPWCYCMPGWSVRRNAPNNGARGWSWIIEQTFTTRPMDRGNTPADPLAEPPKLSGTFVRDRREVDYDRFGNRLQMVSFEAMSGAVRERDFHTATVQVTMNTASCLIATADLMINTVNDSTLWGCEPRTVKFSEFSWSKQYHGSGHYYENTLGFEINRLDGFDREVLNGGMLCLQPGLDPWSTTTVGGTSVPNYQRPDLYVAYADRQGRTGVYTMLTNRGVPVQKASEIVQLTVEHYNPSNLLLLGIPSSL